MFKGIQVSTKTHNVSDDVAAFEVNIDTDMLKGQKRRSDIVGIYRLGRCVRDSRRRARRFINHVGHTTIRGIHRIPRKRLVRNWRLMKPR